MIDVVESASLSAERLAEIRRLLDLAFEGDLTEDDWHHALGGWHVVAIVEGEVLAHAAAVERTIEVGKRAFRCGYVEAVATHPDRRHEGLGSSVMMEIERIIRSEFEMGALSTGAHAFYERLGWARWRGPSYVREGGRRGRSEEEDDGIMVLRFGASSTTDLTAPITCPARSGDDW